MSITSLTVLILLVGVIAYLLLNVLVKPVRVVAACLLMVAIAAFIIQNREMFALQGIFAGGQGFSIFSEKRTQYVPNPINDPEADVTFQGISKEDRDFLDEIVQKRNQNDPPGDTPGSTPIQKVRKEGIVGSGNNQPAPKAELAIDPSEVNRSGPVAHKETVKRAQLITRNESIKRAELVRSTQR
jgi:hypothetical protein